MNAAARPPSGRLDAAGAESLRKRAEDVLRSNDVGGMITAAPELYPHMWSWDAAFISIGLSAVSVPRAIAEMDSLLAAQWRNGMIPHIVFSEAADSYFPGADRWESSRLAAAAPAAPETSGICQPPVHALAAERIVDAAMRLGRTERTAADEFLARSWPRLVAWHRWVAGARDPDGVGRVTIHHGWESGMDNSPRWDGPYSRVVAGPDLPHYQRRDHEFVTDVDERPSDDEYDRYVWLIEEMRRVGYDDAAMRTRMSFAVEDVFFSALLSVASNVLADLGERTRKPADEVAELRDLAARFRAGVADSVDPATALARDRDVLTGEWLATETIAGFSPLLCRGLDPAREQALLSLLHSEQWSGDPSFVVALPPSTSPASASFRPREYWRGPQWPVVAWLFGWAFARNGWADRAEALRQQGLTLLADERFGEYYEPFTGEPLGSSHQSWTAAVALDWLTVT